jgi:hypothetical protein
MCKSLGECTIKNAKSEERADILDFCRHGPVLNTRNFDGVHARHPLFKNYPQIRDTRHMKAAFSEL